MGLVTDYFPEGEESIQTTLIKEPVEEARYKQLRREAEKDQTKQIMLLETGVLAKQVRAASAAHGFGLQVCAKRKCVIF